MNVTTSMKRLATLLAIALALTGTQAFAQTPITEDSGSGIQAFSGLGGTTTADPITFDTFNSSLGTLDSVQITLSGVTLSGSAQGTNNSNVGLPGGDTNGPENLRVNLIGTLDVTSAGGIDVTLNAEDTANNSQNNIAVGSSTVVFNYNDVASSPSSGNQSTVTSLGSYLGNGTTQITVDVTPSDFAVTGAAFKSSGSTANYVSGSFNGAATAGGDVQVQYTYTPVPEPGQTAAWMIGFALCVLGGRKYFQNRGTLCPA